MEENKLKLLKILEENSISISDSQENLEMDSIQFISIIIAIENVFNCTINDQFLDPEKIKSFDDLLEIIDLTLGQNL